jgi:hypothetical protein
MMSRNNRRAEITELSRRAAHRKTLPVRAAALVAVLALLLEILLRVTIFRRIP